MPNDQKKDEPCKQAENEILTDDGLRFYLDEDNGGVLCAELCKDVLSYSSTFKTYFLSTSPEAMLFDSYKELQNGYMKLVSEMLESTKEHLKLKNKIKSMKFNECASCAAKPGSPVLCIGCLANRDKIEDLKNMIHKE